MIKFDQFVKVIHDAAISANQAVVDENLHVLEQYFESSDEVNSVSELIDDALHMTKSMLKKERIDVDDLEEVVRTFTDAKRSTGKKGRADFSSTGVLKPKTIIVQCPEATETGTVLKNVNVPLIALAPISLSEISEIKFTTNLEVMVEDEDLNVSFAAKNTSKNTVDKTNDNQGNSTLEIIIKPKETTNGLKDLVQGYERILRAQIPN